MRTTRRVSGPNAQVELFDQAPEAVAARPVKSAVESGRRFIDGNWAALFVGTVHLEQYLRDLKKHTALARRIRRYPQDTPREALRQVMQQPAAQ